MTDWKLNGNTVTQDSKLGTNNGYDLIFETNNAERFRLTDEGNLGIGITNPFYKMELAGDLRIFGDIRLGYYFNPSAEEKRFTYIGQDGTLRVLGSPELMHEFYRRDCETLDGVPAPVWQSVGGGSFGSIFTGTGCPARVGIGTATPGRALDVNGGALVSGMLDVGPAMSLAKVNINAQSSSALHIRQSSLTQKAAIKVVSAEGAQPTVFELSNKGSLTLNYTESSGSMPLQVRNAVNNENLFRVRPEGGIDIDFSGQESDIALAIRKNQEDRIYLMGDGTLYCQGIHVLHAPFWPDYVFERDYPLMPLNELEKYLNENKHLPNVPSAVEVGEKGLDVYEQVRVLTQKVEELTLYILQQQKQIDILQTKKIGEEGK